MNAVRLHVGSPPYTETNPAPSSALHLASHVAIPTPTSPGQYLVQIKATTVIRDSLTWPELYHSTNPSQMGNDFSGTIISSNSSSTSGLQPGDEVYGMTSAARGTTWAEYALVNEGEVYGKPSSLSWEEAAALPLSGMTADQALFEHAKAKKSERVLITGASGAVGMLLVQMAAREGCVVIAATRAKGRDEKALKDLGAKEVVEYQEFEGLKEVDAVVDMVGGEVLKKCWGVVKRDGALIAIGSESFEFVDEHTKEGLTKGKEGVNAKFFIVEPSKESLARLTDVVKRGHIKLAVAKTLPLSQAKAAYDLCQTGGAGPGKIVLVP